VKALEAGLFEQNETMLELFKEGLFTDFQDMGYGHRLEEVYQKWTCIADKEHLLFMGVIAKSDSNYDPFLMIYAKNKSSSFELIYEEIGNLISGEIPKGVFIW